MKMSASWSHSFHVFYCAQESFANEAKSDLEAREPDRDAWKKLCVNFLKGR